MGEGWVIVAGAGGALGRTLAFHYSAKGRRVLALDREFPQADPAESKRLTLRKLDLLAEGALSRCLAETIAEREPIGLLVNAVGQIWNEPVLTLQSGRFKVHA